MLRFVGACYKDQHLWPTPMMDWNFRIRIARFARRGPATILASSSSSTCPRGCVLHWKTGVNKMRYWTGISRCNHLRNRRRSVHPAILDDPPSPTCCRRSFHGHFPSRFVALSRVSRNDPQPIQRNDQPPIAPGVSNTALTHNPQELSRIVCLSHLFHRPYP